MSTLPGQCWGCRAQCWRTVIDRDGAQHLLWPDPATRFIVVRIGPEHFAPGLPYCPVFSPRIRESPLACSERWPGACVIDIEAAQSRYAAWFTPDYRAWLAAWLRDHLKQDEGARDAMLAQWDADAAAT